MILAWILFLLGFLAVLSAPAYYLSVATPWRNPIGRLMLAQCGVFVLFYCRSAYSLIFGHGRLGTDIGSIILTIILDAFLIAIPVTYEYVRRKSNKQ